MANEKVVELLDADASADFTAAEVGTAVSLDVTPFMHRSKVAAIVTGVFVGTVKIQGSHDNVTWTDLMTVTTPDVKQIEVYEYMRAECSAWTSGTIKARLMA